MLETAHTETRDDSQTGWTETRGQAISSCWRVLANVADGSKQVRVSVASVGVCEVVMSD